MLLTISLEPTKHSTKLFVVMKFERHLTWPTFQWLISFSSRNVTGDRSGIYEELYETAFVNEIQRTLYLTNFTVLLF